MAVARRQAMPSTPLTARAVSDCSRGAKRRLPARTLGRRLLGAVGLLVVVVLLSVARPSTSRAESAPSLPGFTPLGHVLVDKSGCSSCPLVITTNKRHRVFALASDSPFPVSLSGRVDVTCANGASYHVFLQSPHRGGPFQLVPNSCVNLESKEVTMTVTSVSLSPTDAERTVTVFAYGSFG